MDNRGLGPPEDRPVTSEAALAPLGLQPDRAERGLAPVQPTSFTQPVAMPLEQLSKERGTPANIRADNGPELTAAMLREWCRLGATGTAYIEPGSPRAETLRGVLQLPASRQLLDLEVFTSLAEAKVLAADWRADYNANHLHSALGMMSPQRFAASLRSPSGLTTRGGEQGYSVKTNLGLSRVDRGRGPARVVQVPSMSMGGGRTVCGVILAAAIGMALASTGFAAGAPAHDGRVHKVGFLGHISTTGAAVPNHIWMVPRSVRRITVDAFGGQGDSPFYDDGGLAATPIAGKGAVVHATLPVKPGAKLVIVVPISSNADGACPEAEGSTPTPGGGEAAVLTQSGKDLVVAGGGGGSGEIGEYDSLEAAPDMAGAGGASGAQGYAGTSFVSGRIAGAPTAGTGGGAGEATGHAPGGSAGESFGTQPAAPGQPGDSSRSPHNRFEVTGCGGVGGIRFGGRIGSDGGDGGGGYHSGGGGGGGGLVYDIDAPSLDSVAGGGGGGGGSSFVERGAKQVKISQGVHAGTPPLVIITY